MKFGICTIDPLLAAEAREAGFDYLEVPVPALQKPLEGEDAFLRAMEEASGLALPVEASNGFFDFDGSLRCIGPDADMKRLEDYCETLFARSARAGIRLLILGSGNARAIPDGWPREKAEGQFAELLARIGPRAAAHGIEIAIEPLARVECNFVNTVDEGAGFARTCGSSAIGVLADFFHWNRNGESQDTIVSSKDRFMHVHLATTPNRLLPGLEDCDFSAFFAALSAIGYDGRISLECRFPPPEGRAEVLCRVLQSLKSAAVLKPAQKRKCAP